MSKKSKQKKSFGDFSLECPLLSAQCVEFLPPAWPNCPSLRCLVIIAAKYGWSLSEFFCLHFSIHVVIRIDVTIFYCVKSDRSGKGVPGIIY